MVLVELVELSVLWVLKIPDELVTWGWRIRICLQGGKRMMASLRDRGPGDKGPL